MASVPNHEVDCGKQKSSSASSVQPVDTPDQFHGEGSRVLPWKEPGVERHSIPDGTVPSSRSVHACSSGDQRKTACLIYLDKTTAKPVRNINPLVPQPPVSTRRRSGTLKVVRATWNDGGSESPQCSNPPPVRQTTSRKWLQPRSTTARRGHWQADARLSPGGDRHENRFGEADRRSHEAI